MINDIIADLFEKIGHTWRIGGKFIQPNTDHVEKVLDNAAAAMYDSNIGDRFESGGLIVEKTATGYTVYALVGHYS